MLTSFFIYTYSLPANPASLKHIRQLGKKAQVFSKCFDNTTFFFDWLEVDDEYIMRLVFNIKESQHRVFSFVQALLGFANFYGLVHTNDTFDTQGN